MNEFWIFLAVIFTPVVIYQVYVSGRIYRCGYYTGNQLGLQLAIVWLMPMIGAIICHFIISEADSAHVTIGGSKYRNGSGDGSHGNEHDHGNSGDAGD